MALEMIYDHDGVFAIDTFMHGWEGITAVYYLPGPPPILIESGPATSLDHVLGGLAELGVSELSHIVLTHIHLDHAGAVGHLAEKFPDATVHVRAEGAPHLADPSRLWASAGRLYPNMEEMWGEMRPVPAQRLRAVTDDGVLLTLDDGRKLEAIYTPGHAYHHMAVLDRPRGDVYAGDALGVFLPDAGVIRPATPPPEFHMELAIESIDRIRALRPHRVFPTHFGPVPDVQAALDEAASRIRQWVEAAREVFQGTGGDVGEIADHLRARRRAFYPDLDSAMVRKLEQTTSYTLNAAGIARYLTKKREGKL